MDFQDIRGMLQREESNADSTKLKKHISKLIRILEELESMDLDASTQQEMQSKITPLFNEFTAQGASNTLKKLRKMLMEDFKYVPASYYMTLGLSLGLAMGTSLGVAFGIPFEKGLVFGQMFGASIGLVAGMLIGIQLDKKKAEQNLVIKAFNHAYNYT